MTVVMRISEMYIYLEKPFLIQMGDHLGEVLHALESYL